MNKKTIFFKVILLIIAVVFLLYIRISSRSAEEIAKLKVCESYGYSAENFEQSKRWNCYANALSDIVTHKGIQAATQAFRQYSTTTAGALLQGGRCHSLAHTIGQAAVVRGYSNKTILTECLRFCPASGRDAVDGLDYGCLNGAAHGIIQQGRTMKEASLYCDIPGVEPEIKLACFHGIGHGVVELTGFDIVRALKLCDELSGSDARFQCGHAVLMEPQYFKVAPIGSIPDSMATFCTTVSADYQRSCFEFSAFLTFAHTLNPLQAKDECRKVPEDFTGVCYERLGEALYFRFEHNPELVMAGCIGGDEKSISSCLFGANRASVDGPDGTFGEIGAVLCSKAPLKQQKICYGDLSLLVLRRHGENTRNAFCKKIPVEFNQICLGGKDREASGSAE